MKYQNIPTTSKFTVLRQVCNYIPPHLVPKLARETGVGEKTRTFDEWSHLVNAGRSTRANGAVAACFMPAEGNAP